MQGICSECGISFERKASQLAKYPLTFCARKCKAAYQHRVPLPTRTAITLQCAACGKDVKRIPTTILKRTFCSRPCASVTLIGKRENHPKWRGGFTPYPLEYTKWMCRRIRKRDGHKCRACAYPGDKSNRLEVHHRDEDKSHNSDENLITLCRKCHNKVHRGVLVCPA